MVFETRLLTTLESFLLFILNKTTFLQHDFMSFVLTFFLGFLFGNQYGTLLTHFRNEVVWEGFLIFLTLVFLEVLGWLVYKKNVQSFQLFSPPALFSEQSYYQISSLNKKVFDAESDLNDKAQPIQRQWERFETKRLKQREDLLKAQSRQKELLSKKLFWSLSGVFLERSRYGGKSQKPIAKSQLPNAFFLSRGKKKKTQSISQWFKATFFKSKKNKQQRGNKILFYLKRLKLFRIGFLFGIFVEGFKVGS